MCHAYDSRPPIAPVAGAAVNHQELTLRAADSASFAAFAAQTGDHTGAGMVVLPDAGGLRRFYEELALRLAEEGIDAVAIDYFGRTAGVTKRDADFPYMEHLAQTKAANVAMDVGAAIDYLRSPDGGNCRSVFTVGFCFGGSNSWLQAANRHGLAGAIGFYGSPGGTRDGEPGPMARATEVACPILALMGGADEHIAAEQVERLRQAWEKAGVEHELVIYPEAPHSFFDRSYQEHADAAADAWQRVLAFTRRLHAG